MSDIDPLALLSDVVDVGEADDLLIQMSYHQQQLRRASNSTPFESPISVLGSMMSPKAMDCGEEQSPRTPHRLSVVEANFSPPRINKRKQSQPHRSIKQLTSLAEKILNGIVVVEPRPQPAPQVKTICLQVTSSASKPSRSLSPNYDRRSSSRGREELKIIIQSPVSDTGSRSPSPNRELMNASPANNPNSKITTFIGNHIDDDFEPGKLAERSELYNSIYKKRRNPGSAALFGSNRMSGFGGTPLDISQAPGASLLNENEFELCSLLRLQPLQYFQSRDTLIRNYHERGFYKKSAAQKMLHIDVNKTGRLYDYFVLMKWMPESEDAHAAMEISDPPQINWQQLL